jgi:hypothetical protein
MVVALVRLPTLPAGVCPPQTRYGGPLRAADASRGGPTGPPLEAVLFAEDHAVSTNELRR